MTVGLILLDDPLYLPRYMEELLARHRDDVKLMILLPTKLPRETRRRWATRLLEMYGVGAFTIQAVRVVFGRGLRAIGSRVGLPTRRSLDQLAAKHGVECELVADVNSDAAYELLVKHKIDLIVSIAAPQIFKKRLLEWPRSGCLNVHGGYLPANRGVFSAFWVLYYDDEFAGATVHFMNDRVDDGDILLRERFRTVPSDTVESLCRKTARLGVKMASEAISKVKRGDVGSVDPIEEGGRYNRYPRRQDRIVFRDQGKRYFRYLF